MKVAIAVCFALSLACKRQPQTQPGGPNGEQLAAPREGKRPTETDGDLEGYLVDPAAVTARYDKSGGGAEVIGRAGATKTIGRQQTKLGLYAARVADIYRDASKSIGSLPFEVKLISCQQPLSDGSFSIKTGPADFELLIADYSGICPRSEIAIDSRSTSTPSRIISSRGNPRFRSFSVGGFDVETDLVVSGVVFERIDYKAIGVLSMPGIDVEIQPTYYVIDVNISGFFGEQPDKIRPASAVLGFRFDRTSEGGKRPTPGKKYPLHLDQNGESQAAGTVDFFGPDELFRSGTIEYLTVPAATGDLVRLRFNLVGVEAGKEIVAAVNGYADDVTN